MKLSHAIKRADSLIDRLDGEDAASVHVLVELAKRLMRLQRPIRQLADAFAPKAPDLNQVPLFDDTDGDGPV